MYELRVTSSAEKDLRRVNKLRYRKAISEAFEDIKSDPWIGKPLGRELNKRYAYRIENYRIVYKFNKKDKVIEILKVRHRSVVYN